METNTETKKLHPKVKWTRKQHSTDILQKEQTTSNTIIFLAGILFSTILLLVKIRWKNIDWKIALVPLMVALQIIFLTSALKYRYKKL